MGQGVKSYFTNQDVAAGLLAGIHIMGWHGDAEHQDPRAKYFSDDPATVKRQADEIFNDWQFDFVVMDWYGNSRRRIDCALALWMRECEKRGKKFAISIDCAAISGRADKSIPGEHEMLSLLSYIESFFSYSEAYLHLITGIDDDPIIFEFGMETLKGTDVINWNEVRAKHPNKRFIHRNIGGFDTAGPGDGSYAWLDSGEAYLTDYYKRALVPSQTKLCFGSWFMGFDNRKVDSAGKIILPEVAVWPGKAVQHFGDNTGDLFLRTVALTNDFIMQGGKLTGVIFNTYNDWQEGTAAEGGIIHNCSAALAGNRAVVASSAITAKPMFKPIPLIG